MFNVFIYSTDNYSEAKEKNKESGNVIHKIHKIFKVLLREPLDSLSGRTVNYLQKFTILHGMYIFTISSPNPFGGHKLV